MPMPKHFYERLTTDRDPTSTRIRKLVDSTMYIKVVRLIKMIKIAIKTHILLSLVQKTEARVG